MPTKRGRRRSAAEIARLVEGYERGGLTRRDYCEQAGIPITTLDYYRRRQAAGESIPTDSTHLVSVDIIEPTGSRGFVLVLTNGRRIESDWSFASRDLTRLVQIVEQA